MSAQHPAAIEIQDLSYAYRSHWLVHTIPGVNGLSLTVHPGESFGFLGHNGAGKTTTIKCLLGLVRPRAGRIKLFGVDARSVASRRLVGYLPEQPYFYDHLSVTELMEMYAVLSEVPRRDRAQRIAEALELTGISGRSKSPMRSLSKGLTQRVAMAQAIVHRPRLLVLDEPFSGLDPIGRKEFVALLLHLKAAGTTIFMSSHILSDVEFLCERVSILKNGTLKGVFELQNLSAMLQGQYELVLDAGAARCVELGGAPQPQGNVTRIMFGERAAAEAALAKAISAGLRVESYQFVHGGLEELFVRLVQEEQR